MPYIEKYERESVALIGPNTVGQLTYVIYQECVNYAGEDARFADHAEVLAALEAAKLEYYRRRVAPYEDLKRETNGDV